jgi:iron(II)-dependent oxidoreductase
MLTCRPTFAKPSILCLILALSSPHSFAQDGRPPYPAASRPAPVLRMNSHFIAAPDAGQSRDAWLSALREYRDRAKLDLRIYDRPGQQWVRQVFTCHFTFMYDRSFYDPGTGQYALDSFLDDGQKEFGGYDAIVLWQGYPRLGADQRNQFDMYRDMPGGLPGLRDLVRRCHERNVRVFIDYNPWDTGTRREGRPDEEALADLTAAIGIDGIFLDTMSAGSASLRAAIDRVSPGVAFVPEGSPPIDQLGVCTASWAQWLDDPIPPGLLHLKWLEPAHMQFQIRRWDRTHRDEIEAAFFNGSGMMVWENIFGTYNPWPAQHRATWRRAAAILHHFAPAFSNPSLDPFYPTLAKGLFANRWPGKNVTLFTLVNRGEPINKAPLLKLPVDKGSIAVDLWTGAPVHAGTAGGKMIISGSIERLGCYAVLNQRDYDHALNDFLKRQRDEAGRVLPKDDPRMAAKSLIEPIAVPPTKPVASNNPPPGMVLVPGSPFRMRITHMRRECGCYPDPGTPPEKWVDFLWGSPHDAQLHHDIKTDVKPFFIDEAQVSNADFKRFLDATAYHPKHPENFLKHWNGGQPPVGLEDHPVVYIDLDDARAYAAWAGKRLPTEAEWQLAAQGTDGRKWPWGNEFDASRCNTTGDRTLPVRSCPAGRSPYGLYHMSGNVWEWTESQRDDGHTRFVMLRGGSYFDAKGSIWYIRGGPQPCDYHAKFIQMWPGLDRCATIGFRCVADVQ